LNAFLEGLKLLPGDVHTLAADTPVPRMNTAKESLHETDNWENTPLVRNGG
jgi:hypothetical protein